MIYMDNAATTWPKPASVYKTVLRCMERYGANPGRSGHRMAVEAGNIILYAREFLCEIFNIDDPFNIVFTSNCTESLNLAIKGLVKLDDHVIITSMEHNAVVRPIMKMKKFGLKVTIIECDSEGLIDPDEIKKSIQKNTRLIITTHASNVTGTLMPVDEISKIAREHNIPYLLDAAQTAGVIPIDVSLVDMMAFPGHKGLLGPQGTGGLYISPDIQLDTLKEGGTGSQSENIYQPDILPDKYESGTLNTPGIAGLAAGIEYIMNNGQDKILERSRQMEKLFIDAVSQIKGVILYGPVNTSKRHGAISINIKNRDSSEIANILDQRYSIATRGGLHCSPLAHKTLGTLNQGTVRFSPGIYTTMDEINSCIEALEEIAKE